MFSDCRPNSWFYAVISPLLQCQGYDLQVVTATFQPVGLLVDQINFWFHFRFLGVYQINFWVHFRFPGGLPNKLLVSLPVSVGLPNSGFGLLSLSFGFPNKLLGSSVWPIGLPNNGLGIAPLVSVVLLNNGLCSVFSSGGLPNSCVDVDVAADFPNNCGTSSPLLKVVVTEDPLCSVFGGLPNKGAAGSLLWAERIKIYYVQWNPCFKATQAHVQWNLCFTAAHIYLQWNLCFMNTHTCVQWNICFTASHYCLSQSKLIPTNWGLSVSGRPQKIAGFWKKLLQK